MHVQNGAGYGGHGRQVDILFVRRDRRLSNVHELACSGGRAAEFRGAFA
jgi:hypothetical protein